MRANRDSTRSRRPYPRIANVLYKAAMTIPFRKLKAQWLKDPAFRAEYEALAPEFALARVLIRARSRTPWIKFSVLRKARVMFN